MRTFLSILIAGSLFMASCSKDQTDLSDASDPALDQAFILDLSASNPELVEINLADLQTSGTAGLSNSVSKKPTGYLVAGDFSLSNPITLAVDFAAVENHGGVHGDFHMQASTVGTVIGKSRCLVVDGNHVVVGVEITEATIPQFVGLYAHFHGIDNGEGANANPDMVYSVFVISPALNCEYWAPANPYWNTIPQFTIEEGNLLVK